MQNRVYEISGITQGSGDTVSQSLTLTATSSNSSLVLNVSEIGGDGSASISLSADESANFASGDSVQVIVSLSDGVQSVSRNLWIYFASADEIACNQQGRYWANGGCWDSSSQFQGATDCYIAGGMWDGTACWNGSRLDLVFGPPGAQESGNTIYVQAGVAGAGQITASDGNGNYPGHGLEGHTVYLDFLPAESTGYTGLPTQFPDEIRWSPQPHGAVLVYGGSSTSGGTSWHINPSSRLYIYFCGYLNNDTSNGLGRCHASESDFIAALNAPTTTGGPANISLSPEVNSIANFQVGVSPAEPTVFNIQIPDLNTSGTTSINIPLWSPHRDESGAASDNDVRVTYTTQYLSQTSFGGGTPASIGVDFTGHGSTVMVWVTLAPGTPAQYSLAHQQITLRACNFVTDSGHCLESAPTLYPSVPMASDSAFPQGHGFLGQLSQLSVDPNDPSIVNFVTPEWAGESPGITIPIWSPYRDSEGVARDPGEVVSYVVLSRASGDPAMLVPWMPEGTSTAYIDAVFPANEVITLSVTTQAAGYSLAHSQVSLRRCADLTEDGGCSFWTAGTLGPSYCPDGGDPNEDGNCSCGPGETRINGSCHLLVPGATIGSANLSGANLSGADLSGANLNGAELYGANLDGANLSGANLNGANLDGANLSGANLNGANLDGAFLYAANLVGANLSGATLGATNLNFASLNGANLSGANLNGANLDGANLNGANLNGANFSGATLYQTSFVGAYMEQAQFNGSALTRANLSNAIMTNANFQNANLFGSRLTGATLDGANLSSSNLYGSDFTGASVQGAVWDGASYCATQMPGGWTNQANCGGISFPGDLSAWNFDGADLRGASFHGVRMDVSLRGANLVGASFGNAYFVRVDLTGALFCGTRMPGGVTNNADCAGANLGIQPDGGGGYFGNLDFSGANFTGSSLRGSRFDNSDLSGANLSGADLTGADFGDANLAGANLIDSTRCATRMPGELIDNTHCNGANLRGLDLSLRDLGWANLGGANLIGANLGGAILDGSNLTGAQFCGTFMPDGTVNNQNCTGADLSGLNMSARSFGGVDLGGANLVGTNFYASDLTGANLAGAQFCRTRMPDGSVNNSNCPAPPANWAMSLVPRLRPGSFIAGGVIYLNANNSTDDLFRFDMMSADGFGMGMNGQESAWDNGSIAGVSLSLIPSESSALNNSEYFGGGSGEGSGPTQAHGSFAVFGSSASDPSGGWHIRGDSRLRVVWCDQVDTNYLVNGQGVCRANE